MQVHRNGWTQERARTLMSSTICCQNTSNNLTFSGIPLNLRTAASPFSSLGDSPFASWAAWPGPSVSLANTEVGLGSSELQMSTSTFCSPSLPAVDVFARSLAFWILTFSASRRAAASSCLLVSSGSSLSASRAAYAASRSINEMTICLMLTFGCNWAVADRKGPSV